MRSGLGLLGPLPLLVLVLAWGLGRVSGYDPVADVNVDQANLLPSAAHLLGTDPLGRDVAARLLLGVSAFFEPGLVAGALALALALPLGGLAGATTGLLPLVLGQLWTAVASIPRLVLVLLACAIHGNDALVLGVAAGLASAPALAQAIATRVGELAAADYILATRAHGVSRSATLLYHLLWLGCRGLIARQLLELLAFVMVLETSLSYLGGFGIAEPRPSWGNMIAFAMRRGSENPWALLAPGLATWGLLLGLRAAASTWQERPRA